MSSLAAKNRASAVVVAAFMLRYDYQRAGIARINRFTGPRKEFCELNGDAWIWTVNRFLPQQPAAPDGKASTVQTVRHPTTN
jgi:hypothetical protein